MSYTRLEYAPNVTKFHICIRPPSLPEFTLSWYVCLFIALRSSSCSLTKSVLFSEVSLPLYFTVYSSASSGYVFISSGKCVS